MPAGAELPEWARGELVSITRTADETSVVCDAAAVPTRDSPAELEVERGWRALKVAGPLDFALTGVLASIAMPLAEAGISVFVISTYDTDYVLIREVDLEAARAALVAAGHSAA